jgi:chorismate lyase/3-hydroxybenzoate synthase
MELEEHEHGGVTATAAFAYAQMLRFQEQSAFPHLLRIWNYLDAINEGAGDQERYREFCVGRTEGLGNALAASYPAATAIGHQYRTGALQVYWLAGRTPGRFIENPRQVSAYRYPRAHGPASPTFARATLTTHGSLLVSGTASIVGHVSQHNGDPLAQLDETLRNLAVLNERADALRPAPVAPQDLLKVYVRDPAHLDVVAEKLQQALPNSTAVYLAADICRSELLLEIECVRLTNGA